MLCGSCRALAGISQLTVGIYFSRPSAKINVYSHASDLRFKLDFRGHRARLEDLLRVEVSYGLQLLPVAGSWVSAWRSDEWRTFVLDHVLAHEIGHHVFHYRRMLAGDEYKPRIRGSEQFAEDYALRHSVRRPSWLIGG
jgi:hypothetical protein